MAITQEQKLKILEEIHVRLHKVFCKRLQRLHTLCQSCEKSAELEYEDESVPPKEKSVRGWSDAIHSLDKELRKLNEVIERLENPERDSKKMSEQELMDRVFADASKYGVNIADIAMQFL